MVALQAILAASDASDWLFLAGLVVFTLGLAAWVGPAIAATVLGLVTMAVGVILAIQPRTESDDGTPDATN